MEKRIRNNKTVNQIHKDSLVNYFSAAQLTIQLTAEKLRQKEKTNQKIEKYQRSRKKKKKCHYKKLNLVNN